MENGILGGLLGGLLVGAMPGIQRKGSHVSVGVRQHRPRFVLYLGWGIFLFFANSIPHISRYYVRFRYRDAYFCIYSRLPSGLGCNH